MYPYPYKILTTSCPSEEDFKKIDRWCLVEFFRIEALLRSIAVMEMYAKDPYSGRSVNAYITKHLSQPRIGSLLRLMDSRKEDSLRREYNVAEGWLVLKGLHHWYLSYDETKAAFGGQGQPTLYRDILAVTEELSDLETEDDLRSGLEGMQLRLRMDMHQGERGRYQWFRIDAAFPPQTIINIMRPILVARHKEWKFVPHEQTSFVTYHPSRRPFIRGYANMKRWFECMACYDLRSRSPQPTYGEVGNMVFGTSVSGKYERAKKSCKRFEKLIKAAVSKHWPPRDIK